MNISDFDIRIDIFGVTTTGNGQSVDTINDTATYSNIWAKEVKSNLTDDFEKVEFGQVTAVQKRAWVIRKSNLSLTNKMIVKVVGLDVKYHIIDFHPYGADRELIVIETMSRDND